MRQEIYTYILHDVLHTFIFYGDDEKNFWNNEVLHYFLITSFFLTTFVLIEHCYYKEKLSSGHF